MAINFLRSRRLAVTAAQPHPATSSGASVVIDNGFPAPLTSCVVTFGPTQAGSGDPSPSNVRTISGRTGLSVSVSPTASGVTEYPVSWTDYGTVYGGALDIVSGLLTVTYKKVKFLELPVGYNNQGYYYATVRDKANGLYNIVSEVYKNVNTGAAEMPDYSIRGTASNQNVFIMDKRYSNTHDLLAAVGDTYVAYELLNPVAYQLPATAIREIRGENHIWSDAGNVSVTYYTI